MEVFIKKLFGHSGCELSLMSLDEKLIVRKTSADKIYNERLKNQCIKQLKFKAKGIYAPAVRKHSINKGIFFFDMDFVYGITLAKYSSTVSLPEIADFTELLFKNLYSFHKRPNPNANAIFSKKIAELEKTLSNYANLAGAFSMLKNFDWQYVYKSPCHGDLTLENIIVTPNKKLYLIDFLDSFYDSWMIDVAKLLQDLDLKWSFRHQEPNMTRELRLLIAKEAIINKIKKMENSEILLETIYHLLLLNVIRIYPYTKDEKTLDFLNKAVEKIINILNDKGVEKWTH